MKRGRIAVVAAALLAALAAPPIAAHRGHDGISVVTIEGQRLTVSHRFEAHDIEPALPAIAAGAQASLDDPEARAAFEAHLARRFLVTVDGRPVALAHIGTEVSPADVRVEFAGTVRGKARQVRVRSAILTDVYPRQPHQVNVRVRGTVRTARLAGGGEATLRFD